VDSSSYVYAAEATAANEIYKFNAGHTANIGPDKTIVGAGTGLNTPQGIAVDSSGNIYVANDAANTVTVYSSAQSDNATPIQTISGASTLINSPFQLVLWSATGAKGGFFFAP
jgi:DNA-binding beta-propeller fold protein YncE